MKNIFPNILLLAVLFVPEVHAQQIPKGGANRQAGEAGQPASISITSDASGGDKAKRMEPAPEKQPNPRDANVTVQVELEKELTKLASVINTKLAAPPASPERKSLGDSLVDFFSKLAVLIATIIGIVASYKGLKKVPMVNENKEVLVLILGVVVLAVIFYFLSGLVSSVLYVLIALIVLLIALVISAAHFLKFIDEKYPDTKGAVISYFSGSPETKSVRRLARDNVRSMQNWLESIILLQKLLGKPTLMLMGSFVEGFDSMQLEIQPDDSVSPHWRNIDDRMLVPIKVRLLADDSNHHSVAEVVNVQSGVAVIRLNGSLEYRKFDYEGQKLLLASFLKESLDSHKAVIENMHKWSVDLQTANSESAYDI